MPYTVLTATQAVAHLRAHFQFSLLAGTQLTLSPVSGGLANSNYRLYDAGTSQPPAESTTAVVPADDGGSEDAATLPGNVPFPAAGLLIKLCDEKGPEDLQSQGEIVTALHTAGFPTARVYEARVPAGRYVTAMPRPPPSATAAAAATNTGGGDLGVLVFDFVPGRSPPALDTTDQARDVGRALAALHLTAVPAGVALPPFAMGVSEMRPLLEQYRALLSSQDKSDDPAKAEAEAWVRDPFMPLLEDTVNRLAAVIDDARFPRGMLHGDLFSDNMIFVDGRLAAVIDFEETCDGALALDVAMTLVGCCYTADGAPNAPLVSAMLEGYAERRAITAAEREGARDFVEYALLSIAFWRFRQFNVIHPGHAKHRHHQEMVDKMASLDEHAVLWKW
jgi:Ser/Thr protein kinase RdoA (MazF antagonist)